MTELLRHPIVLEPHPRIVWPVCTPPKKADDVSFTPSRRHIENTAALLDAYGISVRWDLMRHRLELIIPGPARAAECAENSALARVFELAERHGLTGQTVIDHLQVLATDYHPVHAWIDSKPWDSVDRVSRLTETVHLQPGADAGLCGALLLRWLVSCAAAVHPQVPGTRSFTPQGVLVFQGDQGIGKTEWFKALAPPDSEWVLVGCTVDPHSRDSVQQATSYWIVELGELDATYRRADISALKAWVTKPADVFRAAYARREERIPRRTVLGASVNPRYFLVDDTGNRRWWTIPVEALDWQHKIDTQQLWAQVSQVMKSGARWWLDADEDARLAEAQGTHLAVDPVVADLWATWQEVAVSDVDHPPRVRLDTIWHAMPGRENRPRSRPESMALSNALRAAGVENDTMTHGARTYRVRQVNPAAHRHSDRDWNDNGA